MITKKQFMLLFCVFLFAAVAYQTQPVEALPFDNEYNDVFIAIDDYEEHFIALTIGDVISGYMETDDNTMGLDFFICDAANFTIWDLGGSATGFEVNTNMHTLGFEWTVTYDATFYVVLSNVGGSQSVWVDYAIDINGDNTPFYSTSTYDHTGYGEFVETDEYMSFSLSLSQGAVIDGHFSTFFATDGLDFFICDANEYTDFVDGFTPTVYSSETDMHAATIDTFTAPSSGNWYFVFFNNGQTDTITYSYGITVDNSNTGGGVTGGITLMTVVGVVAGLLILLILCCVCRSKKKDPGMPPTQPTGDYRAPPSTPTPRPTETVREREIVRDRVLVICPYCGSKNEQGILTCQNCDAEL